MFKKLFVGLLGLLGLVTASNAAPLAAPDTTDLVATIAAFGGAAIAVWIGYITYPIAIKVLKGLFR